MSCAVSCHVYISLNALLRRDDVMIMLCDVKLIVFVNGAEMDAVPNIWKHSKHEETFLFLIFTQLTLNSAMLASGKCSSKTMFPHSNILTLQKFVLDVWSLTFFENFTLDIFYCLSESKLPPPSPAARRDYPEKCPLVFSRLRRSYLLFSRVCVNDCCIVPW